MHALSCSEGPTVESTWPKSPIPFPDDEVREVLSASAPLPRWSFDPASGCLCHVPDPAVVLRWQQDPTGPRPAKVTRVVFADDDFAAACECFLRRCGQAYSRLDALNRADLG